MMQGIVNLCREATLSLAVGNSSDQREVINTVIDTGFDAILPNTNQEGALTITEAMRQAIAVLAILHAQSKVSLSVTLSLGVAALIPQPNSYPNDLIAKADAALYSAKHPGRNLAIAHPG